VVDVVFPERFLWGASTSGFQFEMGNASGNSLDPNTDWYAWVHDKRNIENGVVSGDFPENGVDYWHMYKYDHDIAKELGFNAYRVGVEWSRIFPRSTANIEVGVERASDGNIADIDIDDGALAELEKNADNKALDHYRDVIVDLRQKGFKIFVCLNHFTLPLWIHDPIVARDTNLGKGPKGWVDEASVVEFTKYVAYVAWKLGDIVDSWATFNEPAIVPEVSYLTTQSGFPPAIRNFKAYTKAIVHMALAHARAYDAVKRADTVKADEESSMATDVGLIHNVIPMKPLTDKEDDLKATKVMDYMHNNYFMQSVTKGVLEFSFRGRQKEAKAYMRDKVDWIGVNYYTRSVVKGRKSVLARLATGMSALPDLQQGYGFACEPRSRSHDGLPTTDFGWEIYPQGILEALNTVKPYGKPMYITENGIADAEDTLRPRFLADHLKMLERAISEEKIDLRGYFHWSLTDNYEWAKGFGMKFGLYTVDLKTKKRTPRKSAETFRRIIETGEADTA
jgi:beta-galactosidase